MEANAAKFVSQGTRYFDAKPGGEHTRIRHEAFAARLIDRCGLAIADDDAHTLAAGGYRGGQSRRPTADDKDIRVRHSVSDVHGAARKAQRIGPEGRRVMHQIDHAARGGDKLIELFLS